MADVMIDARAVSKRFVLQHNRTPELKVRFLALFHPEKRHRLEEFWALRNISLTIRKGEAVGLVGRNGSGKSTFLKLVAGLHRPSGGQLLVARDARIGTMIELGVGFHPELTGYENVRLGAAIYGLSRREIEAMLPHVVRYSGLEHFMDVPLKNYSSGMGVRLGFAIAAHLEPDILLLDEIFAVGDADFQKQCIRTMAEFRRKGTTILFVSHAAAEIQTVCDRVCVLSQGEAVFDGPVEEALAFYDQLTSPALAST